MKLFTLLFIALLSGNSYSQSSNSNKLTWEFIDLTQVQIRLMNQYAKSDSGLRHKIYLDSVYRPYKTFWQGYSGNEASFLRWMDGAGDKYLGFLNKRNNELNAYLIPAVFEETCKKMYQLTGFMPKGKWYVVFFHGATNLGGLGTGEMVIDLANEENTSLEKITKWLPHEITHQIRNNIYPYPDSTALGSIISEGLAVYANNVYFGKESSLAEHLGYTEKELANCKRYAGIIKEYFEKNKYSTDSKIIEKFRSREEKIHPELPGAIGYYIGYCIIKKYVNKLSPTAWKDVFFKAAKVTYQLSGY